MSNHGFDRVAGFYDGLATLVFGNAIRKAQHTFLESCCNASEILILGGGTGEFLPALTQIRPSAQIYYIDASSKMIAKARQKTTDQKVYFICGTEADIPPDIKFDAVITFFYLDMFDQLTLPLTIKTIQSSLHPEALWLVADFVDMHKWWQKGMLTTMYFFFRITCGLATQTLSDWRNALLKAGFVKTSEKSFYSGFIESCVFRFRANSLY